MPAYMVRFLAGGLFVSLFAVLGDLVKPKSFAGLFGGAPAVALATLVLTIGKDGRSYAAMEARSMLAGAAALCAYCLLSGCLTMRCDMAALKASLFSMAAWFASAFGLWLLFLH
jgi:hypothetical protein